MNRTEAQELEHIIRSDADWLNVSLRHASEVYNLVAPESDEYVCWIELNLGGTGMSSSS